MYQPYFVLPVEQTVDPSLAPGQQVVDDPGEPAMSTSVTRDVYTAGGKLLYHDTWYSSYRSSPEIVRVGPSKPKHKPKPKPKQPAPTDTGTTTTPTTPTTTTPTTPVPPGR